MKIVKWLFYKMSVTLISLVFITTLFVEKVSAQAINTSTISLATAVGNISTVSSILFFAANFFRYLGWAGVVIGVLAVIALLIYKLIASDDTETMKKVQGGITKAVIIVILGLLLLGAGVLVTLIADLLGATAPTLNITTNAVLGGGGE